VWCERARYLPLSTSHPSLADRRPLDPAPVIQLKIHYNQSPMLVSPTISTVAVYAPSIPY
jgi:hypothetical protein